jgi:hypothetical protein
MIGMEEPTRNGSMIIRAAAGQLLISGETALVICKTVIADLFGDEECQKQSPFRIEDGGNVWTIFGDRVLAPDATAAKRGRAEMSISKLDGAIVSFTL